MHGNKYDYSKTEYVRNNDKVIIGCPTHGDFYQTPDTHTNKGHGCPQCGNENRGTEGIYCESYFQAHDTEPGFLYVVKMTGNEETFIKIGITKLSLNKRFGSGTLYKYEPVMIYKTTLEQAYNREQQLLKEFSSYKYTPKKHFHGRTECFSVDVLGVLNV